MNKQLSSLFLIISSCFLSVYAGAGASVQEEPREREIFLAPLNEKAQHAQKEWEKVNALVAGLIAQVPQKEVDRVLAALNAGTEQSWDLACKLAKPLVVKAWKKNKTRKNADAVLLSAADGIPLAILNQYSYTEELRRFGHLDAAQSRPAPVAAIRPRPLAGPQSAPPLVRKALSVALGDTVGGLLGRISAGVLLGLCIDLAARGKRSAIHRMLQHFGLATDKKNNASAAVSVTGLYVQRVSKRRFEAVSPMVQLQKEIDKKWGYNAPAAQQKRRRLRAAVALSLTVSLAAIVAALYANGASGGNVGHSTYKNLPVLAMPFREPLWGTESAS